jgi:hypothetical protein
MRQDATALIMSGRPDAGVQVARAVRVFPVKPGRLPIHPVGCLRFFASLDASRMSSTVTSS